MKNNPEIISELSSWEIKLGVPVEDIYLARRGPYSHITVPENPHVFHCQTLSLREHGTEIISIDSAMVMIGHGVAMDATNENWRFLGTGKKVSATVSAYEHTAQQVGWPPLDALLICRHNLRPGQTSGAKLIFESTGIPYIFGDDTVHISRSARIDDKTSGIYRPSKGVELLVAETGKWDRINLDLWQKYWMHRLYVEDVRNIPTWAINPVE